MLQVLPHDSAPPQLVSARTVATWPQGTFVENIALLPDGAFAVSLHSAGEVQRVTPDGAKSTLAKFPLPPAGLAVADGFLFVATGVPGQPGGAVWRVDPRTGVAERWVELPGALFPNGCTPFLPGRLLVADSIRGELVEVDLAARTASPWLAHELLRKGTPEPMMPGANGVKVFGRHVYVSNTDRALLLRIAIGRDGSPGSVETAAERVRADDFAFDAENALYFTTHIHRSVERLGPDGTRTTIAGPAEGMAGSTALAFGREPGALFATATGGVLRLRDDEEQGPARLVRLEVGVAGHPVGFARATGRRVLMVTTSHADMAGDPTGVWLEEYAIPYVELAAAGVEIVVASPKGGAVPIDPRSAPSAAQAAEWKGALAAARSAAPLASQRARDFDAVFLPGGHGPMFDLPADPDLLRLLRDFDADGKLIAAVCHGPAGLVNARRADGTPLVAGRRVTAYTHAEEIAAKLDQTVPFILETALRERGARFESTVPRGVRVVRDGRLLTGQNPASSAALARALVAALGAESSAA